MLDIQQEDIYSNTRSSNLIKDVLGIPRGNTLIRKRFKLLLFREIEDGVFQIKKPKDDVVKILKEQQIPQLNSEFYKLKCANDFEGSEKIYSEAENRVRQAMKEEKERVA